VGRVQQYLKSVGYRPTSADYRGFVTALATLMVLTGHVELVAMTIDVIEAAHHHNVRTENGAGHLLPGPARRPV
jgi:hypothetical protein